MQTKQSYNVYTAAAAAKRLNVSLKTIYKWVKQGRLIEAKIAGGDVLLVSGESVDLLAKQRELNPPRRGRKPKAA